jgi:hypothetical protein
MKNLFNQICTNQSKQVHTTNDYFLFKSIDGNRTKNLLHLNRLKKSIANNYLFTIIVVNENYEIIDGQHRFDVIQELNLPLNYVVCDGYSLNEVHILNQNSKTWNSDDYTEGFCNLGNTNYIEYRNFKNKYKFGHHETMAMLTGIKSAGSDLTNIFKNGNFKISNYLKAVEIAEKIYLLQDYYEGFKRRSFIYAMLYLFEKPEFEFAEFLQKVKNNPSSLIDCTDTKQYISVIEEIYNYRRREKINLRY